MTSTLELSTQEARNRLNPSPSHRSITVGYTKSQDPPTPTEKLSAKHCKKLVQKLVLPLLGKQFHENIGESFFLALLT